MATLQTAANLLHGDASPFLQQRNSNKTEPAPLERARERAKESNNAAILRERVREKGEREGGREGGREGEGMRGKEQGEGGREFFP